LGRISPFSIAFRQRAVMLQCMRRESAMNELLQHEISFV